MQIKQPTDVRPLLSEDDLVDLMSASAWFGQFGPGSIFHKWYTESWCLWLR